MVIPSVLALLAGTACPGEDLPQDASITGESGYDAPSAVCGNGFLDAAEECDDGNLQGGDGCTPTCTVPCGLSQSTYVHPPTPTSTQSDPALAALSTGGVALATIERLLTTNQDGTVVAEPRRLRAVALDRAGTTIWDRTIDLGPEPTRVVATGDAAGDVLLATTALAEDTPEHILVIKLAGATGEVVWSARIDSPAAGGNSIPAGLVPAPGDDVMLSAQLRQADGDDDLVVVQLRGSDGVESRRARWSGAGNGVYSTDDAGPIVVTPDGVTFALASDYEDPQTHHATLVRIDPSATEPTWAKRLQFSGERAPAIRSLRLREGLLYVGVQTTTEPFVVQVLDADGTLLGELSADSVPTASPPSSFVATIATPAGIALGGTTFVEDREIAAYYGGLWLSHLSPTNAPLCTLFYEAPRESLVPPSLEMLALEPGAHGETWAAARYLDGESPSIWLGSFRPPE